MPSSNLYRDLVESSRDLIYRLDPAGIITFANKATAILTGYDRSELVGTRFADLVRPDYRQRMADLLAAEVYAGALDYCEFPVVTRSGQEVWLGQLGQPLTQGDVRAGIQGDARDITRKREVQEALRVSEERLRAFVECLGEGLIVTDAEDRVLYVNPAFEEITGYASVDLVGNRAFDLVLHAPGGQGLEGSLPRRFAGLAEKYELHIRHREGHWVDLRVIATSIRDRDGAPFAMIAAVSDVTDQKRAEKARDESEERFRQLAENIREAFWISTADLRTPLYVSPAYHQIMGGMRDEPGTDAIQWIDRVHPDDRAAVESAASPAQVMAGGFEVEYRVIRSDGEVRWIHNRGFPVRDPNGEIYRVAGVAEDVTEGRAAREAMRWSEASYRSLYNSLSELVYIQDLEGRFLNVNDAVVNAYGYSRDELLGADPTMLADPELVDLPELMSRVQGAIDGKPQRFEFWGKRKDGTTFPKEVVLTRTEYFGQAAVMAVARDITQRKQAEAESERLAALSRENPNPVLECDASGRPVHVNPAAVEIVRELDIDSIEGLLPADHIDLVAQALERGAGFHNVEVIAAGRMFEWTYRPHVAGNVVHLFASDVTGRRLMEEQLRHDALHDALTDLPNRLLFMERLDHIVQRARRREGNLFAVLFLDLDRFKVINDSLGHHVGDELLINVAERLRGCLRTEDTVARFGGDEFAILVESIGDASDATRVAERIHDALSIPVRLDRFEVVTSVSVGIALGSSADDRPADLLRNADMAMYRAKSAGPGGCELFDREMHTAAVGRLHLETELRRALERGEIELHYQPIVEISTGRITSLEALLRWRHPERGWLLPDTFVPIAEETSLIRPIGEWVLREACTRMARWRERYGTAAPATIAINLSAKQFSQADLLEQVQAALRESGLPSHALCLEITESAMMENADAAIELLGRLKALGVRLSVDDFGTGYSSLSYLHRFPLDELKIDRSFVARMFEDERTMQLIHTMITLAHSLGVIAVPEGIEQPAQLEALTRLGAEYGQGFHFARALAVDAVEELLARDTATGVGPGEQGGL